MSQLHSDRDQGHFYEKQQSLEEEIDRLNKLVISYLTEKEQTEATILALQEKISDLKYNNGQLKSLNEKLTHLHSKEIDMMRREALQSSSNDQEKKLLKEK